ncbi:hypothetical protein B0T10DRAFT_453542 [Thelonectria olida]|uniref:Uncharacterized protein n=1 Tax=Thelonectria olida TaxID=1576542 RepID=A0A9P9ASE2_9HYPO|nr:hypothetical protein B0T10DRAFT_453542 [Thelonectria olida]
MCTQNIYTYVYPDGYREAKYGDVVACEKALRGSPCASPAIFEYPPQPVNFSTSAPYSQLPPTPQYSPLPPSTPIYRSGDDSDRSFGSSSSKKKNRSSGIYINGQKVLDLNRRERRREHIVVVDSPPTPRTPPQNWSVPASPNSNTYGESSHRRPVVLNDERNNRVQIEVVANDRRPRGSHSRHTSSSSHHSDDEEKRRRRRERELKHEEEEMRKQRFNSRIVKANREISDRPAVPMAPALKRASTYKRPAVEVLYDPESELKKEARREERARQKEDEAQRIRLKERMSRGSVSPGGRHRVMYDDGTSYRWE